MNVKNAIVQGENYRFTVLTPSMIRMEYSEKGVFVDKKTQMVVNRTFDVPEYTVNEKNGELIIETDKARLVYTGGDLLETTCVSSREIKKSSMSPHGITAIPDIT